MTEQARDPVVHGVEKDTGLGPHGLDGGRAEISTPVPVRANVWGSLTTFTSFREAAFRWYYAGTVAQMASINMQQVARSLLVYKVTGSATALGLMSLANAIPMLAFSFVGGVAADRFQKKHVLIVGQSAQVILALAIGVLIWAEVLSAENSRLALWLLLGYSLVQGVVFGSVTPARQSLLAETVDDRNILNAVALTNFGQNVFRLLAPALVGFLIEWFGFASTYYAMAGLYFLSVVFTLFLPDVKPVKTKEAHAIRHLAEGFRYVRRETLILLVLAVNLAFVLLSLPYLTLLPIFTEDILKVGAGGLGMLVSVSGIGALVVSFFLASLPNKRRGLTLILGSLGMGVALTVFSFSSVWALSLVMMVFIGAGQTFRMTLCNSILQNYVKDEYRGRVFSIYIMEMALLSLSAFVAATASDVVGVEWALGSMAVLMTLTCLGLLVFSPRLRRLA